MVKLSVDKEAIGKILNHPKVYPWLTDDKSPDFYIPVIAPTTMYLMDESELGIVRLDKLNGITCSVHIATLPDMWGRADKFVKEVIQWWAMNTGFLKAVAMIPEYNDRAINIAKRVGFVNEGVLKKSFLKNWKLHDQIIFGLCKENVIWQ